MYTLYCHTNKVNGKKYFGVTGTNPKRRWAGGHGYTTCPRFNDAIVKYGWDNFDHEILADNLTEQEAHRLEREYIEANQTTDERYGYNQSVGGKGGRSGISHTEDWKRAMSERQRGRTHSDEHNHKVSESMKGRTFTDEHRRKLSEAKKGKKLSKEHRLHMSEAQKGRITSEDTKQKLRESKRHMMKPVYCEETDTTYESVAAAARALGVSSSNLSATCRGKFSHVGGYHVRFANPERE